MSKPSFSNEALRVSTAKMLSLDINNLTAAQSVKLDRCCMLRLLVDDLRAKQLSGQQIDVREFVAASESLERMVGDGSLEGPARFSPDHRAKLRQLIENAMRGSEAQDAEDEATMALKDEAQAIAAAAPPDGSNSGGAPPAAVGRAQGVGDVSASASPPAAPDAPVLVETPPPQRPRAKSEAELIAQMDKANSQPALPPDNRAQREPWRSHVSSDGIIAPWWSGGHG